MSTVDSGALLDLQGTLRLHRLSSPNLAGNALGDPSERLLPVYLPPGYDGESSRRYPVLYCLHGYTGSAPALVAKAPWSLNVVQRADRLIAQKKMPPVLLAIVDGWTRLGGSQYVDSIHNGRYSSYVVQDIIPFVDASYRTIAREGGRAVFGKSSGGFGALHMVFEHPGTFAAFASHSGDTYFPYCFIPYFGQARRDLEPFDGFAAFVADFEGRNKPSTDAMHAMMILGMGAAYSPRAAEPFAFDLPFDLVTGELRDDVFRTWLAFDPVERIASGKASLERLRLRYLDCGRKDEYNLDAGARIFARRARDLGLEIRHEEFDDDHRNVGYRYDVSLPALAEVLDRE